MYDKLKEKLKEAERLSARKFEELKKESNELIDDLKTKIGL